MFSSLGRTVARHARLILLLWLVGTLAIAAGVLGGGENGLFNRLHSGEPVVDGAESHTAKEIRAKHTQTGETLLLLLSDVDLTDTAALAAAMGDLQTRLDGIEQVAEVLAPVLLPDGTFHQETTSLLSSGGDGFAVRVALEKGLEVDTQTRAHDDALTALTRFVDDVGGQGRISSDAIMVDEVVNQIQQDLQTGEAVALPISTRSWST